MRQHIKNKPIKLGFKICSRSTPKTGYLYEFCIRTDKNKATQFCLGESTAPQLTEKLTGNSLLHIF